MHEVSTSEYARGIEMRHIIVNDEQAKIVAQSGEGIEIRDSGGNHLGYVAHGFDEDDIAIATRRQSSDEPRVPTEEVLKHLESLGDK